MDFSSRLNFPGGRIWQPAGCWEQAVTCRITQRLNIPHHELLTVLKMRAIDSWFGELLWGGAVGETADGDVSWSSRFNWFTSLLIFTDVYWFIFLAVEFDLLRTSKLRWGKVSSLRPRLVVTNASGALAPNIRCMCLGIPCEIIRPTQRSCCP